jgi:hypothetical protein
MTGRSGRTEALISRVVYGRQAEQSAVLLLYGAEVCACLVEGEKIRSEGGCFRSVFVEVGGQRHSRVREREIGTKWTNSLSDSLSNQPWTALQAWYLYPQARAPDILVYYRYDRPTMDSVNTASKRPYSTLLLTYTPYRRTQYSLWLGQYVIAPSTILCPTNCSWPAVRVHGLNGACRLFDFLDTEFSGLQGMTPTQLVLYVRQRLILSS